MTVPFTLVISNHLTCETHSTPLASMNFLSIFPARIQSLSLSGGIACAVVPKGHFTSCAGQVRIHVLHSEPEICMQVWMLKHSNQCDHCVSNKRIQCMYGCGDECIS